MPKPSDKDVTAYRESCTQCVDLRRQVSELNAKLAAKPERPKYELKWRGCECPNQLHWTAGNTRDILLFLNLATMLLACAVYAFADRATVGGNILALLFCWPFIPAVYLLHAVKIVRKES